MPPKSLSSSVISATTFAALAALVTASVKVKRLQKQREQQQKPVAEVIIAGGGIVGLTLALALKKHLGITAEIYEKATTFETEAGAGLGMYPNGLRVLRDISPELLQDVRDAGWPYKFRVWQRHDGSDVMKAQESMLSRSEADLEPLGIRRSRLQKVLHNHAIKNGIVVHFNSPLVAATEHQQDGLIEVKFGDGTTRRTKILFGADGASGMSRTIVSTSSSGKKAVNAAPTLKYTGVTCFMGIAKGRREGIAFPSSDQDDFHAVFFPTAKDETCFQFHMPIEEQDANKLNWGNLSDEVSKEECRTLATRLNIEGWDYEQYIKPLENTIKAVRVGFALLEPRLKSWVKGRIVLVGDAAHPPVPYIGQGAQQGLEDAGVVVALLKIYCLDQQGRFDCHGSNFDKAMDLYQKIRIKRSSQILDFSKSLGNMQASRSRSGKSEANVADTLLKGEVLMYGTLPIMMNGADHDYKEDIMKSTTACFGEPITNINKRSTREAMDYLLGIQSNCVSPESITKNRMQMDDAVYALSEDRIKTLVNFMTDVLEGILKRLIARRNVESREIQEQFVRKMGSSLSGHLTTTFGVPVDEICDVIPLPDHSDDVLNSTPVKVDKEEDPNLVVIPDNVHEQLRHFLMAVSKLYKNNPFHNFDHACHVTVSTFKLLHHMEDEKMETMVQNRKLKITDPLTEFSCVLAALLHDADHEGVPNTLLQKEQPDMDIKYKGKALAEQHSVDVGWRLLMDDRYTDLRSTLYQTEEELSLFRKLIVNIILATDIVDKDLKKQRQNRWEKAMVEPDTSKENINRKATIGIEHLIQASDVSHTMQPFSVYVEWNERLFAELWKAYQEGRSSVDPSTFWFKGEIGFFDFYIIPLVEELEQCEVFGSSSEEFLANAKANRQEWVERGEGPVNEMIERVKKSQKDSSSNNNKKVATPSSPSSPNRANMTEGIVRMNSAAA